MDPLPRLRRQQALAVADGPSPAYPDTTACPFTLSNRAHSTYVFPASHVQTAPSPRWADEERSALSLSLALRVCAPREYVRGESDGLRLCSLEAVLSLAPSFSGLAFSHRQPRSILALSACDSCIAALCAVPCPLPPIAYLSPHQSVPRLPQI
ncbi:hypothetical protein BC628DRAFT_686713 [Trametes gibbosa]|nr:hypothetical protein BC628DRAFT_686713 [Trametes gibbosa]